MISMEFEQSLEVTRRNGRLTNIYERLGVTVDTPIDKRPTLLTVPTLYRIGRYSGDLDQRKINLSAQEENTSREHAFLRLDEQGRLFIRDEKSRNGTFFLLNGKPVKIERGRDIPIHHNDVYMFGPNTPMYQFRQIDETTSRAGWLMQLHNAYEVTQPHVTIQQW